MDRVSGSFKKCATCAYWSGARKAELQGRQVVIPNVNEKGKCEFPRGGCRGQTKTSASVCSNWLKWQQLK